jgi:hypothetical protein
MANEIYAFLTLRVARGQTRIELSQRDSNADMSPDLNATSGYRTIGTSAELIEIGEAVAPKIGAFRLVYNPDIIPFDGSFDITSGVTTFDATAHGLSPGDLILVRYKTGAATITGISGILASKVVASTPTANTFTVATPGEPDNFGNIGSSVEIVSDEDHTISLSLESDGSDPFATLRHRGASNKLALSMAIVPLATGTIYAIANSTNRSLEYMVTEAS